MKSWLKRQLEEIRPPRVPRHNMANWFRQLATLLGSGVGLLRAIDVTMLQADNPLLKSALREILLRLDHGFPLSRSMARCRGGVFTPLHYNLVRAGEISGALPMIMDHIARYEERDLAICRRVTASLTYPLFVLSSAIIMLALMVRFVLPAITATVASLPGVIIPWPTRVVLTLSDAAGSPFALPLLLGLSLTGWRVGKMFFSTPLGKLQIDQWKLRLPLVGKYLEQSLVIRLCLMLETLYHSGVPTLPAMKVVAQVTDNECLRDAIMNTVMSRLQEGDTFSRALELTGHFPPMITQLVWAGEETGRLGHMLHNAAELYQIELEADLARMTTLLEPALITILGAITCFILLAAMLPIYQLITRL